MGMKSLDKLDSSWNGIGSLVVYGYGRRAVRLLAFIERDFKIQCIIDNNPDLRGKKLGNAFVQSFDEVKTLLKTWKEKIIVTTGGGTYLSIKQSLESIGLVEFKDFCRYEDFLIEWYWKNKKQVIMSECYLSITSRCTFKCKNCNQLMPYYTESTHFENTVQEIEDTLDAFFDKVDYLVSLIVIGGEPLLHKDVGNILELICSKYGNKTGYVQIVTNGSLIPKQELIDVIKRYAVDIRLSDYTYEIPYEKKFQEVKDVLTQKGIVYSISKYEEWYDLGIPGNGEIQLKSEEEIRKHTIACGPCHLIAEKRFYYCGTLYSAVKCGFAEENKNDFIDLTRECSQEEKEKLLAYSLGELEKNNLSLCNRCFGKGEKDSRIVKPAVQVEV